MYKFSERKGKKMNAFKTERLSEHLIRITDITEVCCYLVVGTERACLLDTCLGYGDLLQCVRELTDLPVSVILSQYAFISTSLTSVKSASHFIGKFICFFSPSR